MQTLSAPVRSVLSASRCSDVLCGNIYVIKLGDDDRLGGGHARDSQTGVHASVVKRGILVYHFLFLPSMCSVFTLKQPRTPKVRVAGMQGVPYAPSTSAVQGQGGYGGSYNGSQVPSGGSGDVGQGKQVSALAQVHQLVPKDRPHCPRCVRHTLGCRVQLLRARGGEKGDREYSQNLMWGWEGGGSRGSRVLLLLGSPCRLCTALSVRRGHTRYRGSSRT